MWYPSPNLCNWLLELGTLTVKWGASVTKIPVGAQFLDITNVPRGEKMILMLKFVVNFGTWRDHLYHLINHLGVHFILFTTLGYSVKIHNYIQRIIFASNIFAFIITPTIIASITTTSILLGSFSQKKSPTVPNNYSFSSILDSSELLSTIISFNLVVIFDNFCHIFTADISSPADTYYNQVSGNIQRLQTALTLNKEQRLVSQIFLCWWLFQLFRYMIHQPNIRHNLHHTFSVYFLNKSTILVIQHEMSGVFEPNLKLALETHLKIKRFNQLDQTINVSIFIRCSIYINTTDVRNFLIIFF